MRLRLGRDFKFAIAWRGHDKKPGQPGRETRSLALMSDTIDDSGSDETFEIPEIVLGRSLQKVTLLPRPSGHCDTRRQVVLEAAQGK
jgi:hypothetical protein